MAYLRDRNNTEITYLQERLQHRDAELDQRSLELAAERERFDVIQQLALQRIEALTTGTADQRQDAPTAAPAAPGRDGSAREGDPCPVVDPDVEADERGTLAEDHRTVGGVRPSARVAS